MIRAQAPANSEKLKLICAVAVAICHRAHATGTCTVFAKEPIKNMRCVSTVSTCLADDNCVVDCVWDIKSI